jgi:uncharacterized protein YjiS (DUF1127 family)
MQKTLYIALHQIVSVTRQRQEDIMTIKSITAKLSAWRRYRASVRELSQLSDRELADLGLNRYDIETVARRSSGL